MFFEIIWPLVYLCQFDLSKGFNFRREKFALVKDDIGRVGCVLYVLSWCG